MRSHRRTVFPLLVVVLGTILVAPGCTMHLWGPERPGPEITPTGNYEAMAKAWSDAIAGATSGSFTISFTDAELTGYLQEKLAANTANTFQSAQVYLLDDKRIRIYGVVTSGNASAPALLVLLPDVSDAGRVRIVLDKAQVGPISLPNDLLTTVTELLIDLFSGPADSAKYFRVRDIVVGDGQISVRCSTD